MIKVLLICSQGASTAVLCDKIREAAVSRNYDIDIHAAAIARADEDLAEADVILLGPQVRYMLNKVKGQAGGKPVAAIDMQSYGTLDGEKVFAQIVEMLGES